MITKLHPTDLIAVEVPSDATEVHRSGYEILGEINKYKISVDYKKFPQVSLTIKESRLLLDHNDNIDLRKLLKENGLYFEAQGKLIILKPIL